MTPRLKAALYLRVSSDGQSTEAQRRDGIAFCEDQGYEIAGIYEDDGKSAATGKLHKRLDYARLLDDARAGRMDLVVGAEIDRLTRTDDIEEQARIFGPLQRARVRIALTTGDVIDLNTSHGRNRLSQEAGASSDWLEKHRRRIKAGKITSIARGWSPSGRAPYGYRFDRVTKTWSIVGAEAEAVREIHRRIIEGETCQAIAIDLDARGLRRRGGGRWTLTRIWLVATNPTYLGKWIAHKARGLTIDVPALITEADLERVRAMLKSRGKGGQGRRGHSYLLSDLATCGRCGARVNIASANCGNKSPMPSRYVCSLRLRWRLRPVETERCDALYHRTADVDAALWADITAVVAQPAIAEMAARKRRDRPAVDPQVALRRARAELARIARAESVILDRADRIDPTVLDQQLAKLAGQRLAAKEGLAAAERSARAGRIAPAADEVDAAVMLDRLRALVASAGPEQRRRIAQAIVSEATIGDAALWVSYDLRPALLGLPSVGAQRCEQNDRPTLPLTRREITLPAEPWRRKRAS